MSVRFVGEEIRPVPGSIEAGRMAAGEPGLPRRFLWRDREVEIAEVLETWKSTGESAGDRYVRRHWFRVRAATGEEMRIYLHRQDRRWRLYSVSEPGRGFLASRGDSDEDV